jgi:hypothetical protein
MMWDSAEMTQLVGKHDNVVKIIVLNLLQEQKLPLALGAMSSIV